MVMLTDTHSSAVTGSSDEYRAEITRVESSSTRTVVLGQKWVALPREWLNTWRTYCDTRGTSSSPPSISFSSLKDQEINSNFEHHTSINLPSILRKDLQENVDYMLVPWETFAYLRETYGAEENVLVFDTVQMGPNSFKIELYPPLVCFYDVNGNLTSVKCVSRTTLISQIVREKRIWVEVQAPPASVATLADVTRPPCKVFTILFYTHP